MAEMTGETPELPIRWSLTCKLVPRWVRLWSLFPLLPGGALLVHSLLRREWALALMAGFLILTTLAEAFGRKNPPERIFELTYGGAYPNDRAIGGVEWHKVRRAEFGLRRVRLWTHPWFSPLVLELPDDPGLRERIFTAVRAKASSGVVQG